MKILISGTSCGVGRAAAVKYLEMGHEVVGLDIKESTITHDRYAHHICDIANKNTLPDVTGINVLVNNAGIVTPRADAIAVNLEGYVNCVEKYGYDPELKSLLVIGSTASKKGYDNVNYNVSQGGRDALVQWCATNFSNDERHVLCNGLRLDGIVAADPSKGIQGTCLEPALYEHPELMEQIANLSSLKRLTTVEEIAEWIYFITVINTCVTGQIIDIDGELTGAWKFIPYPGWND